ncbi:MAG: helix-turn-helix domain-containing protein [Cellvibrionaceae bacterium]|nr:helix-turn-helix domain-containing protein [Cellvibrionaceae bacterium]
MKHKEHREFAKRFNQAVKQTGVRHTQKSLAKLLGVSTTSIWHYRNGSRLPRVDNGLEMAKKLGVSGVWLIEGMPKEYRLQQKQAVYHASAAYQALSGYIQTLNETQQKQALKILKTRFTTV